MLIGVSVWRVWKGGGEVVFYGWLVWDECWDEYLEGRKERRERRGVRA